MTDEQKYLKEHFLEPETRCDFYVDENRKALWKVQLDMLEQVDAICKKHNIKYVLAFGSLLGAVRHKGFIPWDDDIDVMMPRPDYNRFRDVAQNELSAAGGGYYLHSQYNDKYYESRPIMNVRKHNTAAIERAASDFHYIMDMSVFIDIFPVERIPNSRFVFRARLKLAEVIEKIRGYRYEKRYCSGRGLTLWRKFLHRMLCISCISDNRLSAIYDLLFFRYAKNTSLRTAISPVKWRKSRRNYNLRWVFRPDAFEEVVYVPFEYLTVPIPAAYDHILTTDFGDWHTPVRGGQKHSFDIIDLQHDYRDILINRFGYKPEDFEETK